MAEALSYFNPTIHVAFRLNHHCPLCKGRGGVMKVTMSQSNQSYLVSINDQIEAHLRKAVAVKDPLSVYASMHHLVFSAPRDTASVLCVAACELVGGCREQAVEVAAALHVLHAASSAHENLPLSDRPSLIPKSEPIMHHALGPNIELLTGDAMIPFGVELITKSIGPAYPGQTLRVIVEITRAFGSQGLVQGQYNELQCIQLDSNGSLKMDLMNNTCEKKEGRLHGCEAFCGALLGGGSEEEIEKCRKYGLYFGMIQGMLRRWTMWPKERSRRVEELRELALKELEGFDEAKVEAIASLIEANLSPV